MTVRFDFRPDKMGSTRGTLAVFANGEDTPLFCDTFDLANASKRRQIVEAIQEACEALPAEDIERALLEKVGAILAQQQDDRQNLTKEADLLAATPTEAKDAALEVLRSPELFERIRTDIESVGVAGEDELKQIIYLVMTSRLMDKPLSAIVQGASASGKSFTIETVAKLMPPEAVVQAHDFTDQALYYLPMGSLEHRVVVSGERVQGHRGRDDHAEDNSKAFREMVGSGVLRKAVTVKGPDGGHRTQLIEQPGPIAFLESSTATQIHDEDATRLLPLATDESAEQTRKVVEAQRREAKGQIVSDATKKRILLLHHTMQRLLKPLDVRIPFIDSIALPENNVATRRTYQQFRYAINAVVFLRQYQKHAKQDANTGQDYIEADEVDYEIAHDLMSNVLARKYSPLNHQSREMLETIIEHTGMADSTDGRRYEEFTQADCERWTGLSNATVRRRLGPLVSVGVLSLDATSKPYKYTVVNADLAKAVDLDLPSSEDIAERIAIMTE